jgi:glycerophosphoryl diester phosphodiesterase
MARATDGYDLEPSMTLPALRDSSQTRCLRVGHGIVKPGSSLEDVPARLAGADWDMVELDVLNHDGELVVAHDPADLSHPRPIRFAEALAALRDALPAGTRFDVDVKATGYEREVIEAVRAAGLTGRTLVSTMELSSLEVIRAAAPELTLGLSVPKARRDYLASRLTRPAAYAMLAYLRLVLPSQTAAVLKAGQADAIMAHWGVVTGRLVQAVRGLGAELYVWTVDDPQRLLALERLGVTGVITNDRELFTRAGLAPTGDR